MQAAQAEGDASLLAGDAGRAMALQARIDAAAKMVDIPEAAAEAQRLQQEIDAIKARLAAARRPT